MNVNFNTNFNSNLNNILANGVEFPNIDLPNVEFPDLNTNMPLTFEKDTAPTKGFADVLQEAIEGVNAQHEKAMNTAVSFVSGESVDLHQVMIEAAKAETMTHLASQVTSRVAQSYQTLMNMQI